MKKMILGLIFISILLVTGATEAAFVSRPQQSNGKTQDNDTALTKEVIRIITIVIGDDGEVTITYLPR